MSKKMELQLAMDMSDINQFWDILEKTHDLIDYVELGNIGAYYGATLITEVKAKYPGLKIVWDQKAAYFYTNMPAILLGADYVTIFPETIDRQYKRTLEMAHERGIKVICDLLNEDFGSEAMRRAEKWGFDQISLHPNIDDTRYPVGDVRKLEVAKASIEHTEIAVFGGFTVENVRPVLELKPDVVVVGKAIWEAEDPRKATQEFLDLFAEYED